MEMQVRAMNTSTELNSVNAQESALNRKIRLSEATEMELKEVNGNDLDARVWQGIGKMFLASTVKDQIEQLERERKDYKEQIVALGKKKFYLETTLKNVSTALNELKIKQ